MKNRILALSIAMLGLMGNLTNVFAEEANQVPWQQEWALTISVKKTGVTSSQLMYQQGILMKGMVQGTTFKELNELISAMIGKPTVISPEYVNYYMEYVAIGTTLYSTKPNEFSIDDDLKAIMAKSKEGTLVKEDLRGKRWIHMVNALDLEEKNCLAISKVNGVIGGCGDIWQDGISESEVVCHKGFNYFKCQVDCMDKIYNRQAEVQPGFCSEN